MDELPGVFSIGEFYTSSPEKKLLSAILWRAIVDLQLGRGMDYREARGWIDKRFKKKKSKSGDITYNPSDWSFEWLALQLDLDPDKVREAISTPVKCKDIVKNFRPC